MANQRNPASSSLSTPLLSPESPHYNSPYASDIAMDNSAQHGSTDGHLSLPIKSVDGKDEAQEKNPDEMASLVEYTQDGAVDIHGRPSIKSKTGSWKACPFILGNECCERLAYYGINTNMVVYLINVLHQGKATAAKNVNNWSGTCYITPIIGAFVADAFLGRYWTIASFSAVYFVGMALLTLTTVVPGLKPQSCSTDAVNCNHASVADLAVFYLALYLIALGTGGIKPCVSSFGADQFDETDPVENKRKSSFFNWFYFSINIGALIASSVLVYIQDNVSWGLGFGIPTVAMGIAICSFFVGTPLYRHQKPGGSPLTRVVQVCVVAFRNRKIEIPSDPSLLYETKESVIQGSRKLAHSNEFLCLDKAATKSDLDEENSGTPSPWHLCTVTQVEELKMMIRLMPIWATTIIFSTIYSQMSTLFVEQGQTMDTSMGPHFNIPAAALSIFDTLSVILWVPIYDRLLVPVVRYYTGDARGFTQLQRMGIGLVVSVSSMVAAAIVEINRLRIARSHDLLDTNTPVPMSIFWQVPQYFLVGAAEVFTFIGQLEFFYDQSPDATRSLCSALSLLTTALGSYLSAFLVTIVTYVTTRGGSPGWIPDNLNIGHMDYFFWLLAAIGVVNFFFYLACAHWYKYKKVQSSSQ